MANVNCVAVSLRKGSLTVGETTTAYVDVCPENACYEVAWESSNPCVASVSSLGVVFANCAGRVKIIASVTDVVSGKVTTAFNWLVVSEPSSGTEEDTGTGTGTINIPVQSVTVCPPTMELTLGESAVLEVTVCPENATNRGVDWRSRDTAVATVNPNSGLVRAVGEGTTAIIADAVDGSNKRGGCTVVVKKPVPATSVTVCPKRKTLGMNDIAILHATVCPCEAAVNPVKWFSSDPSVATVGTYTGIVTPVSSGTTTITALVANGSVTDTCTITVDFRERVRVTGDAGVTTITFSDGAVWQRGADENVTKTFSEQQLAFLYLLDPLGVENYMKHYYRNPGYNEQDYLFFKDRVYQKIFGVKPLLFRVMPDGTMQYYDYPNSISSETREAVYSYAEVLFGSHSIVDAISIIDFAINVVTDIFTRLPIISEVIPFIDLCQALFFSGAINGGVSGVASYFIDKYVSDTMGSNVSDMLGWVDNLLGVMLNMVDSFGNSLAPPNWNDITIYHRINSDNYYTNFVINGSEMSMEDIINACMSN